MTRGPRLLILRLSAIGDVVHTLPALELLRSALPRAELTWAVEPPAAELLAGHPALDRVLVLDRPGLRGPDRLAALRSIGDSLAGLRRGRFDAALDLQGLARSALVGRWSGAPRRLGPRWAREGAPWLYTDRLDLPRPGEAHAVTRYAEGVRQALRALGWPAPPDGLPRPRLGLTLPTPGADAPPRLALLVGAGKPANRLPPALLAAVARELLRSRPELELVLLGGPGERGLALELQAGAPELRLRLDDRVGRTRLREAAAELACCQLVVGGDTGLLHLARALGRPVLGLYPAADPFRTGPDGLPGPAPAATLAGSVSCAPCRARRCLRPDGDRICLRDLTPERVAAAALELLSRATESGAPAVS